MFITPSKLKISLIPQIEVFLLAVWRLCTEDFQNSQNWWSYKITYVLKFGHWYQMSIYGKIYIYSFKLIHSPSHSLSRDTMGDISMWTEPLDQQLSLFSITIIPVGLHPSDHPVLPLLNCWNIHRFKCLWQILLLPSKGIVAVLMKIAFHSTLCCCLQPQIGDLQVVGPLYLIAIHPLILCLQRPFHGWELVWELQKMTLEV